MRPHLATRAELEAALARWTRLIDDVAPRLLGPDDRTGPALAAEVSRVSEAYTRARGSLGLVSQAWAARLRFFMPRDLFKIYGPLRELTVAGALPGVAEAPEGRRLRVLDVGAGLGTSSLGVASFLHGRVAGLDVVAVEQHAAALDLFLGLARAAEAAELVAPLTIQHRRMDLERDPIPGRDHDLIVVGLTLNELFADLEGDARLDACEAWLRRLLAALAPEGSLVVIEPASRDQARPLQQLRDRLEPHVFAPCLRVGPCPLLARERDWCHSQLPLALGDGLAETARAAGLRAERLTYAYLTLRADGRRLLEGDPARSRALRLVSNPLPSKGKTERDGCGEAGLVRLRLLDRDRTDEDDWIEADRGTLLRLPAPAEGGSLRIRPGHGIEPIG